MEDIRIIINQLGPIRNSVLELKPFMVFSGESGLGKSYAAFLVHYLYLLCTKSDRLVSFFDDKIPMVKEALRKPETDKVILRISTIELLEWINKDAIRYLSYLIGNRYFTGDVRFEIPFNRESFSFEYHTIARTVTGEASNTNYVIALYNHGLEISSIGAITSKNFAWLFSSFLYDSIWGYAQRERTYLMPPSRGSLVELKAIPNFQSGMYIEFMEDKDKLNRAMPVPYTIPEHLAQSLYAINNGTIFELGGDLWYKTGDVTIPLTAAASSVKELAPLTLYLQKYELQGSSILFEEPEAHLHPARQIKVADLLGCMLGEGCHIQLTTHSDYFLKRLNNLMMLFRLKEKYAEAYHAISEEYDVKEYNLINPASVNAYVMEKGEDGYTQIRKQEITEEGIPYDSFHKVIIDDIKMSQKLRDAFKK
ncbi:MAG: AAA family ATPase [Prevotellaceae bacterium]|jgi:hypothetical protein|nr:AAA family ATPase [Prevotellaceae bacterium]